MVKRIVETFQHMNTIERNMYGNDSFFKWQDEYPGLAVLDQDPNPAFD